MAQLVAQSTFNAKGAERPFRVQVPVPSLKFIQYDYEILLWW